METSRDVRERVISCLQSILPSRYATQPFDLDTRFQVDCDMDSLAFIEFLVAVEEEFGLNLSEDSLRLHRISTIADMVAFVEDRMSASAR